jgi:pimeloyl-ACP methyl ester carboxylesterase
MLETLTVSGLTLLAARPQNKPDPRPSILFIPGYFAGAWVFDKYLPFFAERGYAGYAVDLRGHGQSPLRSGTLLGRVSMRDFIDDAGEVAQWISARDGGARPVIIGHSMGALIGLKLAEDGAARAIVMLSPAPPRGIRLVSLRLWRRQIKYLPALFRSRRVVPRWADVRDLVLNRVPQAEQRSAFERFTPDSGTAARQMMLGSVAVDPERVRANGCPTLVVACDEDRFIPTRVVQRVATKYRAPLFVARGHGHFILQEPGWKETATFIADWLGREV